MKNKKQKKTGVIIGTIVMALFLVIAVGGVLAMRAGVFEAKPIGEAISTTTSADADVYLYGDTLVDHNGVTRVDVAFDEQGNVMKDGEVLVASYNLAMYTAVTEVKAVDETELTRKIEATQEGANQLATKPVGFNVRLAIDPIDAINKMVIIESADPGAVFFPYEENAESILDEKPENANMASVSPVFDENGEVSLAMVGRFDGEFTLVARNGSGDVIGEFKIVLEPEIVEAAEGAEAEELDHEHEYEELVVEATVKSVGYTIHTCKICGYTFRDEYVEQLACTHEYEDTVVPATYLAGGYTVHTCKICGDSYRDSATPVLVCSHAHMKDTVVAPTCSEQGYTIHECLDCHNYTSQDAFVAALGHNYGSGKVTAEPTCGREGTKTFTCTRCGETRTEAIAATGNHTYVTSTLAATCTEGGCTVHTCSVCGDSYQDNTTAPLGHSTDLNWNVTQPATCGATGTKTGTCTRCGAVVRTESIPVTGQHQYTTTTVSADCEHGGHTVHTCSVCGDSYTDGETEALGHAWEAHTERRWVRQEAHEMCADCGMDLTAAGITGSAIADHVEWHILNDPNATSRTYTAYVDIYEEVTVYTCTRCGATRTES